MICFELLIAYRERYGLKFLIFTSGCPNFFCTICWKTLFSFEHTLVCLLKIKWPYMLWICFWTLVLFHWFCVGPFAHTTLSLNTVSSQSKSGNQVAWVLQLGLFFFKCLTVLGPMVLHVNFRINVSVSMKLVGIFMGLHWPIDHHCPVAIELPVMMVMFCIYTVQHIW